MNRHNVYQPQLSVVIIGRNEGSRLVRCLESVRAMRLPPDSARDTAQVEIIYVDSASTDGSPERATALGATVITVQPQRPTAALGRNAGWRAASAPFVLFLDGDTILEPDFVVTALAAFADPYVAVVCGHRRELYPHASFYNRVLDLEWIFPTGPAEFCGGDALIRRDVLEQVGGYDETLIAGEEPEMCRRMRTAGHTVLRLDHIMTWHDLAMTRWSQYWRRAVRTGYAYAEVAARFRGTEFPLWEHEVRHNLSRGSLLVLLVILGVGGGIVFANPWFTAGALGLQLVQILRTAWKIGRKSPDSLTRLLYGLHAHFQHLPILCGQLSYHRDRWTGRKRGLIEYKEVTA